MIAPNKPASSLHVVAQAQATPSALQVSASVAACTKASERTASLYLSPTYPAPGASIRASPQSPPTHVLRVVLPGVQSAPAKKDAQTEAVMKRGTKRTISRYSPDDKAVGAARTSVDVRPAFDSGLPVDPWLAPLVHILWAVSRPFFPRFFPFFARFHRLDEAVPTSPNPESRAKKQCQGRPNTVLAV